MRRSVLSLAFFIVLVGGGGSLEAASQPAAPVVASVFLPVQQLLLGQQIDINKINAWLGAPQTKFEARLLASMLSHTQVSRDYENFFRSSNLRRARAFKNKYQPILEHTFKNTSVPPEIIIAIILVESDLGAFTGKTSTFNALASQAVLDTDKARELLAKAWPKSQRGYLTTNPALERFARRADWARWELLALIRLSQKWQKEILDIRGSPAGALGWCQFMPSSIEQWGVDGSGDGVVDLNNPLDAIASVGFYLKEHGWDADLSYQDRVQVLLTYNKSQAYAQAILQLAEKL
jgi:membrane-bound lytic murein transglycosylase B